MGRSDADDARKVKHGRLTVEALDSNAKLTILPAKLDDSAVDSLRGWMQSGVLVGKPYEISSDTKLGAKGVRLTKSYPVPLPKDLSATLAYYDTEIEDWVAVPTKVAADRRSVTATVSHLSMWNDFLGGAQKARDDFVNGAKKVADDVVHGVADGFDTVATALAGPADAIYYTASKIFSTRVDPPECNGATPTWVKSTAYNPFAPNVVIAWCAGRDAKHPELLEVKARVNRGYGFGYTSGKPSWSYNSGLDTNAFDAALDALTELDKVLAKSVTAVLGGNRLIGPGQEISFGFSEDVGRANGHKPIVELAYPSTELAAASILSQMISAEGIGRTESSLAAVITIAKCGRQLSESRDITSGTRAAVTCLDGAGETIAKLAATALVTARPNADPRAIGRMVGKAVARASIALALAGPVLTAVSGDIDRASSTGDELKLTLDLNPRANRTTPMSDWVLSPGRLGPITVGMTGEQLRRLGYAAPYDDVDGSACGIKWKSTDAFEKAGASLTFQPHTSPDALSEISLIQGTVPGFRTDRGVRPGSTVAALKAAYGNQLTSMNIAYGEESDVHAYVVFGPAGALTFIAGTNASDTVYVISATKGTSKGTYEIPFSDGC